MLDKEPSETVVGSLGRTTPAGPVLPPGDSLALKDSRGKLLLIDWLFLRYEGKEIQIDITILEEASPEPRRVRTIRDLTEPR